MGELDNNQDLGKNKEVEDVLEPNLRPYTDEDFSNNLKRGLDIAQQEYQLHFNRIRDIESKLNLIIVIFSAIITMLSGFCLSVFDNLSIFKKGCIISIILVLFCAVLSSIIGVLPKAYRVLKRSALTNPQTYKKTNTKYLQDYLIDYKVCIESFDKVAKLKLLFFNISCVLIFLSLLIFSIYLLF